MKNLKEKVALVTGGAGGIGFAISKALASEHCHLAIADIDQPKLLWAKGQLTTYYSVTVSTHCLNVADKDAMQNLAEEIIQTHKRIDILINNAGVSVNGLFENTSLEDFHWLININLWGTIYGCKFFLPYLRQREQAHIVNILSDFAFLGFPGKAAYGASKAALLGFSNALYTELYNSSIGLSIVFPGPVATDLIKSGRSGTETQKQKEIIFMEKNSLKADELASKVLWAIKKNKYRVRIGGIIYLLDYLIRLFPGLTHRIIAKMRHKVAFID